MTVNAPTRRPRAAARRFGYVIAAALTAVLWYLVNIQPGWRALPFLTEDFTQVLALFNFSLAVSLAVNLIYLVFDPVWGKALGDLVTTGIGVAVLVRIWQVFPFTFDDVWGVLARVTLVLAIVGSAIAIAINVVTVFRGSSGRAPAAVGPPAGSPPAGAETEERLTR